MKIAQNMTELVGNTPLVYLNSITKECVAKIAAKVEFFNPSSSIKDRAALNMIEQAEKEGIISPLKTTIIEPTSGNTGIGLAMICAIKKYRLILTMPENMSIERRKILKAYGAELVLSPAELSMTGSIEKANELARNIENSFIPSQFTNINNPKAHHQTAEEIWTDTEGKVDIVFCGIGTGGTITGIAQTLKEKNSDIEIIGVEPLESPFLTEEKSAPHKIQGIGAGFKPDILDTEIIDEIVTVSGHDAIQTTKKLIKEEGILCGISCGAAVSAALNFAHKKENENKLIVAILPDTGERYLSTALFD